jgi:two-component system, OmpR family, phosphate regulon sensor histidine kinase PhoR
MMRYLPTFLFVYMTLAFTWWAVHLLRENNRLNEAEYALLALQHPEQAKSGTLTQLPDYQRITRRHDSRVRMVFSEGLFFVACLAAGLWIIRRSAQREVALARQRRNFLLSITHELKSPIAAIRLMFDTFKHRNLDRNQTILMATNGLKDAARLESLVSDLLMAARLEDSWKPSPEPLSLPAMVQQTLDGLHVRFPESRIEVDIPEHLPTIKADRFGLQAILHNLVENAMKYTPTGSLIQIKASTAESGKVCIEVADQGDGIPESERTAVFEKFYRLGNEDTRASTGTGLGLYIAKAVVTAHQGSISILDNVPKGTVFRVEL